MWTHNGSSDSKVSAIALLVGARIAVLARLADEREDAPLVGHRMRRQDAQHRPIEDVAYLFRWQTGQVGATRRGAEHRQSPANRHVNVEAPMARESRDVHHLCTVRF